MIDYLDYTEKAAIIDLLSKCDGATCNAGCMYRRACKTVPIVKNIPQTKKFMAEMRLADEKNNGAERGAKEVYK